MILSLKCLSLLFTGTYKFISLLLGQAPSPKANIDGLLGAIDISRCPATHLNLRIRENLIRKKCQPDDNDCDDFIYLPVIPYADISLIEKRLSGWILQVEEKMRTRVFCKPPDAADALMKVFERKRMDPPS